MSAEKDGPPTPDHAALLAQIAEETAVELYGPHYYALGRATRIIRSALSRTIAALTSPAPGEDQQLRLDHRAAMKFVREIASLGSRAEAWLHSDAVTPPPEATAPTGEQA